MPFFFGGATCSAAEPPDQAMARPLTPSRDDLLERLQQQKIVLTSKTKTPCPWGFSQLAFCRSGPGVVVYTAKRFDMGSVLQELEILKDLAAEPCKRIQLPVSWRAWGVPSPTTASAATAASHSFPRRSAWQCKPQLRVHCGRRQAG